MNSIMMRTLEHAYTTQQKHDYNVEYYKKNKEKYWPSAKSKSPVSGGMSDFDKRFAEMEKKFQETSKRHDAERRRMDEETAKQQKKADEFRKQLEEEANKPIEQRMSEQLTQMTDYIKSDEFKRNATAGIRIAKKVLPELMKTAVTILKENKKQFIDLGKSLVNSLFSR